MCAGSLPDVQVSLFRESVRSTVPLEQPAECYLCRGHASRAAEGLQHIHDACIRPHCFRLEAWQGLSVVVVWVENRVFVDAAAQKSPIQRAVWNKADSQFPTGVEHSIFLHQTVHQMIFALDGRQRANGMSLRMVSALTSHMPQCCTLPSFIRSAIVDATSSAGVLGSARCW